MLCCIGRNNIQIGDEEELKKRKLEKDIKKIKKELFKTRINNHVGFGISSNVFKVKLNNEEVCCKVIKLGWEKQSEKEIKILKKITTLNNAMFPKFICNFKQNLGNVICYNFIPGIDLFTYISEKNSFYNNEKGIINILFQLLCGLESLLTLDLIHLDIKPENIIVVSKTPFKICLIDLCFCLNFKKENPERIIGTLGYISPEILFKNKIYHNTDIWSIGILIYLLYTSDFIFNMEDNEYIFNLKSEYRASLIKNEKLKNVSYNLKNIINQCLIFNTNYRISIVGLKHLLSELDDFSTS